MACRYFCHAVDNRHTADDQPEPGVARLVYPEPDYGAGYVDFISQAADRSHQGKYENLPELCRANTETG